MADIDQTSDTDFNITWGRGDSSARGFTIKTNAGAVIDIDGFSFKLTVNSEKDPLTTTNQKFTIVGAITDAPNGKVAFSPTVINTDIEPGTYFYDIEQTDGSGAISTLIIGKCIIIQDITKA